MKTRYSVAIFLLLFCGMIRHSWASAASTSIMFTIVGSGGNNGTGGDNGTGSGAGSGDQNGSGSGGRFRPDYAGGRIPVPAPLNLIGSATGDTGSIRVAMPYITGDRELYSGYKWAFEQGITTISGYNEASMYQSPTRADLAKMISVFAGLIRVKVAISPVTCNISSYQDYYQMTGTERMYIEQACSLGLMGWKNDKSGLLAKFRPHDIISRAEFGTLLSRLMYGTTYNTDSGEKWYLPHLMALKQEGFLSRIDTPLAPERKGYLLLILKRVFERQGL